MALGWFMGEHFFSANGVDLFGVVRENRGAMRNVLVYCLILACLAACWPSAVELRWGTPRLHGSNDYSGSLQDVVRGRSPVEDARLASPKAAWSLLFPIALGAVVNCDVSSALDIPIIVPLVGTLQSQHVLLRL